MQPEDLVKLVQASAFSPFRIAWEDGRTFDVLDWRMIKVGRQSVFLFTPHRRIAGAHDHVDIVSLAGIVSIQPLEDKRSA